MQRAVLLHLDSERAASRLAIERLSTVAPTECLAMATVAEILDTVEHTPGSVGLLPVEDSFEGEDTAVLDRLVFETSRVFVSEEVVVSESLGAFRLRTDRPEHLRTAVSHPRAIEHCHRFVREYGLATRFVGSTDEACALVAESGDPTLAALAPRVVAERAGLEPVVAAVDDVPDARTRFFLVGQSVGARTGHDKTTLVLTQPADRSGSLVRFLQAFSAHDVNLVSLHSRPITRAAGSYCFLATAEAHIHDQNLQMAIGALWEAGAHVKLLGSYPEWDGEQVLAPFDAAPLSSVGPDSSDADRGALLGPPAPRPSSPVAARSLG
jgi:prephenate dehydratase